MAQFVGCLEGMSDACRALDFPIVSGNVSLYNESKATGGGSAILPTPAIGGIGLLADFTRSATIGFKGEGEPIFLIGATHDDFGQSLWLRELHGREDGLPPPVDLYEEREQGDFVRALIQKGAVTAVHDVSDGGVLVAVAEMALAGNIGADLVPAPFASLAQWFSETQGRYVVTAKDANLLLQSAHFARIPCTLLGYSGGDFLNFHGMRSVSLTELRTVHEGFFPTLMEVELGA
jgi:phosphoribosylformylglycinamidine synthase